MTPRSTIRVIVADNQELLRCGLRTVFAGTPDIEMIGEIDNALGAFPLCTRLKPDIVVIDIMAGLDGISAIKQIHHLHPDIKVIVLTHSSDAALVQTSLKAGAVGYLMKIFRLMSLCERLELLVQGKPFSRLK